MEFARNNASLVALVLCSFAIASLIIPFQASDASSHTLGAKTAAKPVYSASASKGDNGLKSNALSGLSADKDCKPDSQKKNSPMEPDRKGHKVKKKSRR